MGNDWKEVMLSEISTEVSYGYTESASLERVGPRFLRITDIQNGVVDWDTVPFCPISKSDLIKYKLKTGDIVVARTGNSTGENYIFTGKEDAVYASYLIKFEIDKKRANPFFVWYNMRSIYWWNFINSAKSGSAQAGANAKVLGTFTLKLPSLPVQKTISHILGAFDKKIELNRQMNQTLELMTQALFKSWFVDFAPVIDNALAQGKTIPEEFLERTEKRKVAKGKFKSLPENILKLFPSEFEFTDEYGWIPKGWKVSKLPDIAEVKYGKDHKNLNEGNIPVYGSGGVMRYVDQVLHEGESVLIPRKGTLTNVMYVNEKFWSVDTMFFTRILKDKHAKYLYYKIKDLDYNNMNVGSAVPSMTTKVLNNLQLLLPSSETIEAFDDLASKYLLRKAANDKEINSLKATRDSLLPRLISGELRIEEFDYQNN